VIGITACLERFLADADERGNAFLIGLLDKQHTRLKALFDRHVAERIKLIEDTKLTSKKRNGVAQFIKYFPVYVSRVENQLIGADPLEIRQNVDMAYERIVQTMFDSLKQMAKLDGEGEDKGQLNYHVILIGASLSRPDGWCLSRGDREHALFRRGDPPSRDRFRGRLFKARTGRVRGEPGRLCQARPPAPVREDNRKFVPLSVRRGARSDCAACQDYFDGVERLLKTTAPTEVANNSSYSRSALKKIVREFDAKDVRKHVDALSKRVEKHFADADDRAAEGAGGIAPGTVMVGVWKACEEEMLRITDVFNRRIAQCYTNAGVSLEYSAADVEAAFKRHRVGS
jgi:hypothetical protein